MERRPPTPRPGIVRTATPADEKALYEILVALHHHNDGGWGFPFDPALVWRQIQAGTRPNPVDRIDPTDERRGMIGVIDGNDELAATIGVFLSPAVWFSTFPVPTELWLFVRPKYRGNGFEEALFAYAKWFRDSMAGAPEMQGNTKPFPLLTGLMYQGAEPRRMEAMERLWRRKFGGKKIGVLFRI